MYDDGDDDVHHMHCSGVTGSNTVCMSTKMQQRSEVRSAVDHRHFVTEV